MRRLPNKIVSYCNTAILWHSSFDFLALQGALYFTPPRYIHPIDPSKHWWCYLHVRWHFSITLPNSKFDFDSKRGLGNVLGLKLEFAVDSLEEFYAVSASSCQPSQIAFSPTCHKLNCLQHPKKNFFLNFPPISLQKVDFFLSKNVCCQFLIHR